jgi:hypothetical protein
MDRGMMHYIQQIGGGGGEEEGQTKSLLTAKISKWNFLSNFLCPDLDTRAEREYVTVCQQQTEKSASHATFSSAPKDCEICGPYR